MNKHKLSNEEVLKKAQELSEKHGVKVHPIVFVDEANDEQIVGYLKEPARIVKQRAMDKVMLSSSSAGEEILTICLITEESNPRILSEAPENDKVYLGACQAALSLVQVMQNTLKKK